MDDLKRGFIKIFAIGVSYFLKKNKNLVPKCTERFNDLDRDNIVKFSFGGEVLLFSQFSLLPSLPLKRHSPQKCS